VKKRKTILILGAGIMQIPAIKIAKKNEWQVIVADRYEKAVGASLSDIFEKVDLKDYRRMAKMARAYKEKGMLDGVFTAGTDFATTVAYVAEYCDLSGISYDTALRATDKSLMRQVFKDTGVPSPDFISLTEGQNPLKVLDCMDFPLVVKPVDNMGARGVRRVDKREELTDAFQIAIESSRNGKAIIESYMDGPELSLDAIVYKGRITITGIADRDIRFPPYFVEMGHTMPSILDKKVLKDAADVFIRGIKALGINTGAAKGDIKVTSKGVMVGEIAARLSGGFMSGWTYPYSTGIEVTDAAMKIAMGFSPGKIEEKWNKYSAERAFISIPGKVKDITGLEYVLKIPGIKNCFLLKNRGDTVTLPRNNVEKCGNIITQARTQEEAVQKAEEGLKHIIIRLEPDCRDTEHFLFSKHQNAFFHNMLAFRIKEKENMQALQSMPRYKSDGLGSANRIMMEILTLPDLQGEKGTDWHHVPLTEALKIFGRITGIPFVRNQGAGRFLLGRLFWDAFLKGGIQGGLYIIDTLTKKLKEGNRIESFLK
jgi:biotin carboxylase